MKYFIESTSLTHTTRLGFEVTGGRAIDAPNLRNLSQPWYEKPSEENHEEWKWLQYIIHGPNVARRHRPADASSSPHREANEHQCNSFPCKASVGGVLQHVQVFQTRDAIAD